MRDRQAACRNVEHGHSVLSHCRRTSAKCRKRTSEAGRQADLPNVGHAWFTDSARADCGGNARSMTSRSKFRAHARAGTTIAVTLMLSACTRGMDFEVIGTPKQPIFEMKGFRGQGLFGLFGLLRGEPPAIDSLSVGTVDGSGHWRPIWSIS